MQDLMSEATIEAVNKLPVEDAFSNHILKTYQRQIFLPEMIDAKTGFESLTDESQQLLTTTLEWIREFIIKPHPNAITPKAVCSHVEAAMDSKLMYMSVAQINNMDNYREFYDEVMRYKNILKEMQPADGPKASLRSLVILMPGINPEFLIPKNLKVELLNEGIMPGAFKPFTEEKPFLKYKFFPVQNPTSMLILRYALEQDWQIFIRWDKDLQFEPDLHPYFKLFSQKK